MLTALCLLFRIFARSKRSVCFGFGGCAMSFKIGRDAKNGRFMTVAAAKKRPKTTVIETINTSKKKG